MRWLIGLTLAAAGLDTSPAWAGVSYVAQSRSISAATSADGNAQSISAPNFAPFVQVLNLAAEIPTTTGPVTTRGNPGIDCQLDPNAIRASGSLTAAGGISIASGTPQPEFGEARADLVITFSIALPTPYTVFASARPSDDPADAFEVSLRLQGQGHALFEVDQTSPPAPLNVAGLLNPGTYILRYTVELHSDGSEISRTYDFSFALPVCGSSDFNGDGDAGTDADIEAFFACIAGSCCETCGSADFNNDGDSGTDADIESFFRVLAGGPC